MGILFSWATLAIITSVASGQNSSGVHRGHWRDRSIAAYNEHVKTFRDADTFPRMYSFWDKFRPAFVCPWQDRLGKLSDGGKWMCNWEALLRPRPALSEAPHAPQQNAPCVIYSFGISKETSWEEDLMGRLEGTDCHLWAFDPTVDGLPFGSQIPEATFSKTGLVKPKSSHHFTDADGLRELMSRHGHAHIDVLKVDIEGSEWALFEDLCKGGDPLPFDMLLIELHRCNENLMKALVTCLDDNGMYPFAREENVHGQACSKQPPGSITDVEMSFVRAVSRFTEPSLHLDAGALIPFSTTELTWNENATFLHPLHGGPASSFTHFRNFFDRLCPTSNGTQSAAGCKGIRMANLQKYREEPAIADVQRAC